MTDHDHDLIVEEASPTLELEAVEVDEAGGQVASPAASTALVPRQATLPGPGEWAAMQQIAKTICNTEFVPDAFRGRPDAALAAILYGREVGIGAMQALKNINIIDGRPAPEAELMCALVRRAGHSITGAATLEQATVTGTRKDTGDAMTVEWTLKMAERAGLTGKKNWRTYPEAMLWARAVSQLCRQLFPDCLNGWSHTPDELGDDTYGDPGEYETTIEPGGRTPPAGGNRTNDRQDTKGRAPAGLATAAQVKMARELLEELDKQGGFVDGKGEVVQLGRVVADIGKVYGVEAHGTLDDVLGRLTGGRDGQVSELIDRLKARRDQLKAAA